MDAIEPIDEQAEFELSQYLDGQLGRRSKARCERRLARDADLRQELVRYASLDGQLQGLAEGELDRADYDAQRHDIMAALERQLLLAAPRRAVILRPAFWGSLGAMAAAAAILLVASGRLFRSGGAAGPVAVPPGVHASMALLESPARKESPQSVMMLQQSARDVQAGQAGDDSESQDAVVLSVGSRPAVVELAQLPFMY